MRTKTLLAAAFTALAITNARAQDSDPGKDSSPGIWSPERQTLTGDWFGQGSAIILDLDRPHQGLIKISQSPMFHLRSILEGDPEARP